eukprot:Rmarinus@m.22216
MTKKKGWNTDFVLASKKTDRVPPALVPYQNHHNERQSQGGWAYDVVAAPIPSYDALKDKHVFGFERTRLVREGIKQVARWETSKVASLRAKEERRKSPSRGGSRLPYPRSGAISSERVQPVPTLPEGEKPRTVGRKSPRRRGRVVFPVSEEEMRYRNKIMGTSPKKSKSPTRQASQITARLSTRIPSFCDTIDSDGCGNLTRARPASAPLHSLPDPEAETWDHGEATSYPTSYPQVAGPGLRIRTLWSPRNQFGGIPPRPHTAHPRTVPTHPSVHSHSAPPSNQSNTQQRVSYPAGDDTTYSATPSCVSDSRPGHVTLSNGMSQADLAPHLSEAEVSSKFVPGVQVTPSDRNEVGAADGRGSVGARCTQESSGRSFMQSQSESEILELDGFRGSTRRPFLPFASHPGHDAPLLVAVHKDELLGLCDKAEYLMRMLHVQPWERVLVRLLCLRSDPPTTRIMLSARRVVLLLETQLDRVRDVVKAVLARQACLRRLFQIAGYVSQNPLVISDVESPLRITFLEGLAALEASSVAVVEAISVWRMALARPYSFSWRGTDYLTSMQSDWLPLRSLVAQWFGVALTGFGVLVESDSSADSARQKGPKRRKRYTGLGGSPGLLNALRVCAREEHIQLLLKQEALKLARTSCYLPSLAWFGDGNPFPALPPPLHRQISLID